MSGLPLEASIQIWSECDGSVSEALNSLCTMPSPAAMTWTSLRPRTCGPVRLSRWARCAVDHVGEDLHVTMAVRSEPLAGRDAILVEHAQGAKAHEIRIVIAAEGERGEGAQPSGVGVATIVDSCER